MNFDLKNFSEKIGTTTFFKKQVPKSQPCLQRASENCVKGDENGKILTCDVKTLTNSSNPNITAKKAKKVRDNLTGL